MHVKPLSNIRMMRPPTSIALASRLPSIHAIVAIVIVIVIVIVPVIVIVIVIDYGQSSPTV